MYQLLSHPLVPFSNVPVSILSRIPALTMKLIFLVLALFPATILGHCCGTDARIAGDCCNVFSCNCDGPCWNAGCKTSCAKGKYPGYPVTCPGNDGYYDCCATGSTCKTNCKAKSYECCCKKGTRKKAFEISSIEYDLDSATSGPDSISARVSIDYFGTNAGGIPEYVDQVSKVISVSQTTSWKFDSTTEISVSAEVEAGVPFFGKGKLSVGAKQTFGYGQSESKTVSESISIQFKGGDIPPYSRKEYQFVADMLQFSIPFTAVAVVYDDCDEKTTETIKGTATLSGVASFTSGKFKKLVGPAIPYECKSPFDTPIEKQSKTNYCSSGSIYCEDNAMCDRLGFQGICCAEDRMKPCCAYAEAHQGCLDDGYKTTDVICPSSKGVFAKCCKNAAAVLHGPDFRSEIVQGEVELDEESLQAHLDSSQASTISTCAAKYPNESSDEEKGPVVAFSSSCKA